MRKIYFLLLCCFSTAAYGQDYYTDFSILVEDFCPYSQPGLQIRPEGIDIYQTIDGFWDGTPDSTRCISVEPLGPWSGMKIALGQINPAEPIFIRVRPEVLASLPTLNSNWLYSLTACVDMSPDTVSWQQGIACEQGVCSGAFIGIAIPDSMGSPGAATRFHSGFAKTNGNGFCGGVGVETCFPTEYFEVQRLQEIVLKFSFLPGMDLEGKYLNFRNLFILSQIFPPRTVTDVKAYPFHYSNGAYTLNISETEGSSFGESYLMTYTAPTYPDNNHLSYLEAAPEPNSAQQQEINLVVAEYQSLEIQPFTNFRGRLVEGSDSIRHLANLVNMGGDFCANFAEFVVSGGSEYRHGGGHITMQNPRFCMQFRTGSALRVLEGTSLHYGNDGAGILVLCPSTTIALERNASLEMDGLLNLIYCKEDLGDQQIYMDLPPGAKLVFTSNAHITNQYTLDQKVMLNVRMLGGTLDDSALDPADRALVHRVYPEPSISFRDNLRLFPNPFEETFNLSYLSKNDETLHLSWFNLSGQNVLTETMSAQKGMNEWQPRVPTSAGMYLLEITGESGKTIQKVVCGGH
jgi:hypothetical protein